MSAMSTGRARRNERGSSTAALAVAIAVLLSPPALAKPVSEHVILLPGLCRTSASMHAMERALDTAGYRVWNIGYPSRTGAVTTLSESVLAPAIRDCENAGASRVHFVGHSLGAILIRDYLCRHALPHAGHVVMLGPPNQGSEVVDKLGSWWLFKKINGPAGCELGTVPGSALDRAGVPGARVGIIAGDRSINWINSLMIPGRDDGKVSVERTKLEGMSDHLVLRTAHPFLPKNKTAIRQTLHFLRLGAFDHPAPDADRR
jgi:hypothetical protein